MLEAIIYKDNQLSILDQLLLPRKTHYEQITCVEEGWKAIKSMKVRGAPAISIVAALSLSVDVQSRTFDSKKELHNFIVKQLDYLETSRPTAVNLRQVADLLKQLSASNLQHERTTVNQMQKSIAESAEKVFKTDIHINRDIGKYGGEHLIDTTDGNKLVILTHCNTGSLATAGYGTALGVIRWLHEKNRLEHVFCTETRPYNQGARLTAFELVHDRIPATLVCDSMVAALMKTRKISAVIVGADRVVANGDAANKIGTYQIAVCAKYHHVPFYVASPRSTFDFSINAGNSIPIEERPHSEMASIGSVKIAAEGINLWNPSFDVTPAELITGGIITECGVFKASDITINRQLLSSHNLLQ